MHCIDHCKTAPHEWNRKFLMVQIEPSLNPTKNLPFFCVIKVSSIFALYTSCSGLWFLYTAPSCLLIIWFIAEPFFFQRFGFACFNSLSCQPWSWAWPWPFLGPLDALGSSGERIRRRWKRRRGCRGCRDGSQDFWDRDMEYSRCLSASDQKLGS